MRKLRFSLRALVIAVGILSVNLAAGRILSERDPWLPFGVMPPGLICQYGILRSVRARPRARLFWIGFVLAGTVAILSYVDALYTAQCEHLAISDSTGEMFSFLCGNAAVPPPSPSWWFIYDNNMLLWANYLEFSFDGLSNNPNTSDILTRNDCTTRLLGSSVALMPQFLFSVGGGLLAHVVVRIMGGRNCCRLIS